MISPSSITNNYILQPTLISKHKKTLEWLSTTILWKRELAFFQKLLDKYATNFSDVEDKKRVDHFQNLILYYNGDLINMFATKLRLHEAKLADILEKKDESNIEYFKEHDSIMNELEGFSNQFNDYKEELFLFIEKVM